VGSLCGEGARETVEKQMVENHHLLRNGAGRIAKAAAEAFMIAAKSYNGDLEGFARYVEEISKILLSTRPTAVSLPNAISYVMKAVRRRYGSVVEAVVRAAMEFKEYSEKALELIGEIGSRMIEDGMTIMTHCNSSAVVSILAKAWGEGKRFRVYATETRPRYQGYITARDLASRGISTTLITDSAVAYIMRKADLVL
jgi:ribose 1,5-bisphosphate isomerase